MFTWKYSALEFVLCFDKLFLCLGMMCVPSYNSCLPSVPLEWFPICEGVIWTFLFVLIHQWQNSIIHCGQAAAGNCAITSHKMAAHEKSGILFLYFPRDIQNYKGFWLHMRWKHICIVLVYHYYMFVKNPESTFSKEFFDHLCGW